ncbi:hypothetical protein ACQEVF_15300 [Nonomuraea polychroma]|uniref:hypothetical protein n=1 Tax=Nonomuraea polychroma TaxID=46176 RepID=UPI003D943E10
MMGLKVGDVVEVRTEAEILATLDERGELDALPFMPELLAYSGRRLTVHKVAHKLCDTQTRTGLRKMDSAVHLTGARCDGSAHGGCQTACSLYWKEAWIKRVEPGMEHAPAARTACCRCWRPTRASRPATAARCATPARPPSYWLKDGLPWGFLKGHASAPTPSQELDLRPGELVRVKPKEEILRTLTSDLLNRGMGFEQEMPRYCGSTARVRARVEKCIDERTGRMLHMKNPCIVLDEVVCQEVHSLNCPREFVPFWREIWLERAG